MAPASRHRSLLAWSVLLHSHLIRGLVSPDSLTIHVVLAERKVRRIAISRWQRTTSLRERWTASSCQCSSTTSHSDFRRFEGSIILREYFASDHSSAGTTRTDVRYSVRRHSAAGCSMSSAGVSNSTTCSDDAIEPRRTRRAQAYLRRSPRDADRCSRRAAHASDTAAQAQAARARRSSERSADEVVFRAPRGPVPASSIGASRSMCGISLSAWLWASSPPRATRTPAPPTRGSFPPHDL